MNMPIWKEDAILQMQQHSSDVPLNSLKHFCCIYARKYPQTEKKGYVINRFENIT